LSVYQNSYFPCTIQAWNSLDLTIRNLPTFSSFKLKLQKICYAKRRNPPNYSIGDRFLSVLYSRMQNKCSALNADLYHANLIVNYNCLCWYFNENAEHYLLHCNRFTLSRIMLFEINKLNLIGIPVNIDLLLFGNETLSCDINCSIFLAVQKYTKTPVANLCHDHKCL
jgi:hypothetical protein